MPSITHDVIARCQKSEPGIQSHPWPNCMSGECREIGIYRDEVRGTFHGPKQLKTLLNGIGGIVY